MTELEGNWIVTSLEIDGSTMPAMGSIVVKGDRFVSSGMGAVYEGKLKLDTTKMPHTLDMIFTKGPEKGNTNFGIFEVKGDTWRMCLNLHGQARPKVFSTKGGGGIGLETFTRGSVAKKPAATKSAATATTLKLAPAPELEGEWQMVSCIMSGKPLEAEYVKGGKRIAKGNDLKVTVMGQTMMTAKFTVDRTTAPMSMDYQLKDGRLQHGIYELSGTGFKSCFANAGSDRPTDFTSTQGDGRTLTEWKKI
jgi:uncharacterized protein (TIGR03067 family)